MSQKQFNTPTAAPALSSTPSAAPGRLPQSQLTVSVCVDGFHKEGISGIQALLQAGSGVFGSSGIKACRDRLKSESPFLSCIHYAHLLQ